MQEHHFKAAFHGIGYTNFCIKMGLPGLHHERSIERLSGASEAFVEERQTQHDV